MGFVQFSFIVLRGLFLWVSDSWKGGIPKLPPLELGITHSPCSFRARLQGRFMKCWMTEWSFILTTCEFCGSPLSISATCTPPNSGQPGHLSLFWETYSQLFWCEKNCESLEGVEAPFLNPLWCYCEVAGWRIALSNNSALLKVLAAGSASLMWRCPT